MSAMINIIGYAVFATIILLIVAWGVVVAYYYIKYPETRKNDPILNI